MDTWNRLPHVLQSLVLGTLIEGAFIAALRLARGRFEPVGPVLDRVGPRKVRDPQARRASAGCAVGVAWFALSWVLGHEALRAKAWIVGRLLQPLTKWVLVARPRCHVSGTLRTGANPDLTTGAVGFTGGDVRM